MKNFLKVLNYIFVFYIPMSMSFMVMTSLMYFYINLDDEWCGLFLNIAGILAVLLIVGYFVNTIISIIIHSRKEKEKQ